MVGIKLSVVLIVACVVQCLAMTYDELEDFAEHLKKTSQLSPTLKKGVDPEVDNDEVDADDSDHAWENSGKFEGDLILNERQRRLIVEEVAEGLSRNGIRDGTKRWPNNEVIYYIQVEHFTSDQRAAIESGLEDIARASCIKFRPYRKGDRDAVVIQGSRNGCFSQVGYQGGYQVLNLSARHPVGRGCFRHGTVVHEMLHTLGFFHMQSSFDRDDYIDVLWENIIQPARHNFRKYNSFSVSDFGVGYDYDSVLHYSRRAFSANGKDTIVPKQRGVQIGQRLGLSDKDTQKLNKMYCDADADSVQDQPASRRTESKKKNEKNKPFEGHGIGYHQGKAVAFKILPAAETYNLPDVPSFHVFDYFSKEPQLLSTSEKEGFLINKEIELSPRVPESLDAQKNNTTVDFDIQPETMPLADEVMLQVRNNNYDYLRPLKSVNSDNKKPLDSKPVVDLSAQEEKVDPDLIEAFDRLSKIVKLHVYPSQTPDLSIYKVNEHHSNHYVPLEHTREGDILTSIVSVADKSEKENMNPAIGSIKNLYDFNSDKYRSEKPDDGKREMKMDIIKVGLTVASDDKKNSQQRISSSFPLTQHYEDDYDYTSGGFKLHSPKEHDEVPNESHDKGYQKYIPYYRNHEYITDYSKPSSRGSGYEREIDNKQYIPSIPLITEDYSKFYAPAHTNKHWYNNIKDEQGR